MKKLLIFLYAICFVLNQPILSAANVIQECYYAEPLEQRVDEIFFQKLILQAYDEVQEHVLVDHQSPQVIYMVFSNLNVGGNCEGLNIPST